MRSRVLASLLVAFASSTASQVASACEEFVSLGQHQLREMGRRIAEEAEFDLDAMIDYETMLCADKPIFRDYARRIGRKSENPSIQSRALLATLLEMETITLRMYEVDGMSKAELEWLRQTPSRNYSITQKSHSAGCMSLHSTGTPCNQTYLVSVVGLRVDLRYDRERATLFFSEDDPARLVGRWENGHTRPLVSLPVELQLD